VYDGDLFDRDTWTLQNKLLARNVEGSQLTASDFFLWLTGLGGERIRVSGRGKTNRLSFRNVAALVVVSEDEMWQKLSPILTKNGPQNAGRKSTFALLLTGSDESGLVEVPKPEIRRASLTAQEGMLRAIIASRDAEVQQLGYEDLQTLSARRLEIEQLRQQQTGIRIATRSQIAETEEQRGNVQRRLRPVEGRRSVLNVLLSRFELLADHYASDANRFEALAEVLNGVAGIPEMQSCPLCGTEVTPDRTADLPLEIERVASACIAERGRTQLLATELDLTRQQMISEEKELAQAAERLRQESGRLAELLERQLVPQANSSDGQLLELASLQQPVDAAEEIHRQLTDLRKRLADVLFEIRAKNPPLPPARTDHLAPANRVADIVHELLTAWSYPDLESVTFDAKKFDIRINGRVRSSHGKGYRAIINAAFILAILRFCREKDLRHPGIVILDSPVLTLKLPLQAEELPDEGNSSETTPADELVPLDMKPAFYQSLRDFAGNDQIIVIENDRVENQLAETFNYLLFTKRRGRGRYGLFPPLGGAASATESS
jgi:hypothetical protein